MPPAVQVHVQRHPLAGDYFLTSTNSTSRFASPRYFSFSRSFSFSVSLSIPPSLSPSLSLSRDFHCPPTMWKPGNPTPLLIVGIRVVQPLTSPVEVIDLLRTCLQAQFQVRTSTFNSSCSCCHLRVQAECVCVCVCGACVCV